MSWSIIFLPRWVPIVARIVAAVILIVATAAVLYAVVTDDEPVHTVPEHPMLKGSK